jgi:peptide/nickel transport system substrate-binding protein
MQPRWASCASTNDAGIEVLRGPRDYKAVRQALAQAGYNGESIVVVAPTDVQPTRALSLVGADQLRRAGMNVDLQAMEQSASVRRRQNQAAPDKGGWNAFFGLQDRSIPNTNPYGNQMIRADGVAASIGWPTSPRIEALRAAWLNAGNINEQRRICTELQMQLWQDVPYIPMGEYWQSTTYRKNLLDVLPGCFAVFWGVRRA